MAKSRIKKWLPLALTILLGAIAGSGIALYFGLMHDLPEIQDLQSNKPLSITRVYSSDGVVLDQWYQERRDPAPLETIPIAIRQAIIATEDRNFYDHFGVDVKGLMRAVFRNIKALRAREGASTITQQTAKNHFLSPEKTLTRKLKEAVLALQLERRYTKDEILELYLNKIPFGSGAFGVQEAGRRFFGKELDELTLAECALIAGMPKAPSAYSPLANKEKAKWRRNVVLKQMLDVGDITQEQYEQAVSEPVVAASRSGKDKAPYFTAQLRKQLGEELGESLLYQGGLEIHTSLNYRLQKFAEQAVRKGVEVVQEREGLAPGEVNAGLICLNVKTGEILAHVGGVDFGDSQYDRAVMAKRQPGSSFKPFVIAAGLEEGLTQSTLVMDEEVVFPKSRETAEWKPENYSGNFQGEICFRRALAYSRNIPAARLIYALSPTRVIEKAKSLGIHSELKPYLSLSLGSSEVTLLELTAAYAAFANGGKWNEPNSVLEAIDRSGQVIYRPRHEQKIAVAEQDAAVIVDMLEAVVKEGSGKAAQVVPGPVAGKTGTSSQCKDALFIGFTPEFATGVWVGRDDGASIGRTETGSQAALPIWVDFMKNAMKDRSVVYFPRPDGVISVFIDPVSGKPTSPGHGVQALFIKGTEPRKGAPEPRLPEKFLEN
ncbi:penicillin-binding protein 1A [Desulfatibacillum aliphaticivorans]|uniref:penicillin-binding protein 1A n=1 Tax=Desulfatibacillum aliphaticivorans TaxID=218208 RepID=UPI00041FD950|nr:PBP1A family penicillin-binding protein [Desulfatibacillum aliphaticivorans]